MTKRRILVDGDACVGSRMCQIAAPELFAIDEGEGRATPIHPEVTDSDALWDAAEGCPNEAIVIEEGDTGRRLFP